MNDLEEQLRTKALSHLISEKPSVIVRVTDGEFQVEVLAKLGRLETKVDMLVGNGQPCRVRIIEEKVAVLERSDVKRNVYDRMISAVIAFAVSAIIALHDHLGLR
jgi:hypothetical protein